MSDWRWRDAVLDLARRFGENADRCESIALDSSDSTGRWGEADAYWQAACDARAVVDRLHPRPGVPGQIPPPRPTRDQVVTAAAAAAAGHAAPADEPTPLPVLHAVIDELARRGWLRLREERP